MPELPEVEALAAFLDGKLAGRTVAAATAVSFQALKTYDPPLSAIEGLTFEGVGRHGKFLDMRVGELHLVIHLARAGWIRWKDELPTQPVRAGKGPLALRVRLTEPESAGFDVTEAGTQKRLAVSLVRDPKDVPGVARLGIEPLSPEFTAEALTDLLRGERRQIKGVLRDQGTIAGIGNA
ncbi:MAG TPA: DNA-formamidopyrimidine glycosylase family protein [Actinospica sp.]|jgi:formamidopyrimidine-DNA glycosylase|nr:DNA-formamidopyrimidine glycosylase family protein [Actinospica sp.]